LILITLIGVFVYTQVNEKYTLEIFGIHLTLPVAVWVVIPLLLLYLVSLFHISFYSFKNYLHARNMRRDLLSVIDSLYFAVFKEPKVHRYLTEEYAGIGEVTDRSEIELKSLDYGYANEKIKKAVEAIKKIEAGEYVEIKDVKFSRNNPLYIRNIDNKIASEPTYSGVILKKCDDYPESLCKKALAKYIEYAELSQIKNYASLFDRNTLFKLLTTAQKRNGKLKISVEDIIFFCKNMDMEREDYMDLAKSVKNLLLPDERLQLFEKPKRVMRKRKMHTYIHFLIWRWSRRRQIYSRTAKRMNF